MLKSIAAFDFDGTLTTRDSLLPFMLFTHGYAKTVLNLFIELPWLLGFVFGLVPRQGIKERLLAQFYRGWTKEKLFEKGRDYAQGPLLDLLIPERVALLKKHQEQGHRCVLVSANIEPYLKPWAEQFNLELICSKLAFENNLFTGTLDGLNCWGPEKVTRLLELLGPKEGYILYAYGDSRGDKEMLELSDHPLSL